MQTSDHILLALSSGEMHGYEIMKQVFKDTDEKIRLSPATLYTSIKRLLELGLIKELPARADEQNPGRERRYYEITKSGAAAVKSSIEEAQRFTRLGEARISAV